MLKKYLLLFTILLCGYVVLAQTFPPKSNTLVTDYTNTLTADQRQKLASKLDAFNDSSSTQIAVVIMKSVGDYDINEYGAGLGRAWGIGQKGKNNGVLVLVAMADHKLTIQTGYGAEGALPDIITQQIRVNDMNPRFKQGDYYGGLDAGTNDIIKYTKGEYKADAKPRQSGGGTTSGIIILIIIVVVILILIFRNNGGGGHVIGGRGGSSPFWWFLAGSALGSNGSGTGWGGSSGGGNDGGGSSGGFGGFGGGDFGGGGSGGSW